MLKSWLQVKFFSKIPKMLIIFRYYFLDGKVKGLLERAFKCNDFHLIKIVKNILKYSDDENINEIFESFIDDHFMKILKNKSDSIEFLIEIVEILSNIDTDWDEKIQKHSLIPFLEKFLQDDKTYDELLLPIILFLGNISSHRVEINFINIFLNTLIELCSYDR